MKESSSLSDKHEESLYSREEKTSSKDESEYEAEVFNLESLSQAFKELPI